MGQRCQHHVLFIIACKRHLIPFTSHSKTEHVFMCTVAHVPGMDETGKAWGSSLASRENSPCSLLHQLWKGASPAAGHWGTWQEWHCSAGCMDPGGQLGEVEKGEWWCAYECVTVSTDWVCSTYTDHANAVVINVTNKLIARSIMCALTSNSDVLHNSWYPLNSLSLPSSPFLEMHNPVYGTV